MLRTRFCERFGVDAPIVVAPMGPDLTGVELVAAVCRAGGFGILQAQLCAPAQLREEIRRLRTLTNKPFGVNFVLHFPHKDGVRVCIEERVAALSLFWGDPTPFIEPAHLAGVSVVVQVSSVGDAVRAARAGADVIIAQGSEAGGHCSGSVSTMALVPRVVDAVAPGIVLAAGGISDARGLVAALAFGAAGVVMGTRFLATPEANAHALYKEKLVAASEGRDAARRDAAAQSGRTEPSPHHCGCAAAGRRPVRISRTRPADREGRHDPQIHAWYRQDQPRDTALRRLWTSQPPRLSSAPDVMRCRTGHET